MKVKVHFFILDNSLGPKLILKTDLKKENYIKILEKISKFLFPIQKDPASKKLHCNQTEDPARKKLHSNQTQKTQLVRNFTANNPET